MFSEIEKEAMNKVADILDEIETKEYIKDLLQAFPNSMINSSFEFIADIKTNQYFRLEDCKNPLDIDCKVLEWLSRAAFKTAPYRNEWRNKKYHEYMLRCINDFLNTDFSEEDMELIYTKLGNDCNRTLCEKFVMSGYDMEVLK